MAENLHTALHHLCHIAHCYRGTVQMYESSKPGVHPASFTAVVDIPDNQLVLMDVKPFISECGKRLMTTNPSALLECIDYLPLTISANAQTPSSRLHRMFLTVREAEPVPEGIRSLVWGRR